MKTNKLHLDPEKDAWSIEVEGFRISMFTYVCADRPCIIDALRLIKALPDYGEGLSDDDRSLLNMLYGWNDAYISELVKFNMEHFDGEN